MTGSTTEVTAEVATEVAMTGSTMEVHGRGRDGGRDDRLLGLAMTGSTTEVTAEVATEVAMTGSTMEVHGRGRDGGRDDRLLGLATVARRQETTSLRTVPKWLRMQR